MFFEDETLDNFDPNNPIHWLLLLALIGFSFYGFWQVSRAPQKTASPTHRYNRQTGKVETPTKISKMLACSALRRASGLYNL